MARPQIEAVLTAAAPELGRIVAAVTARIGRQRVAKSRATPLEALVRAVVYQSISAKAAETIYERLGSLSGRPITPAKVLRLSRREVAAAGLSKSKVAAIVNLAGWFRSRRGRATARRAAGVWPEDNRNAEAGRDVLGTLATLSQYRFDLFVERSETKALPTIAVGASCSRSIISMRTFSLALWANSLPRDLA